MKRNAFIRADASAEIGTGHVMRCATLAGQLSKFGLKVCFISRQAPGDLRGWIEEYLGLQVFSLPSGIRLNWRDDRDKTIGILKDHKPDLMIVDHYELPAAWETAMRPWTRRILAIDDFARRRHDCDFLLNQNLQNGLEERYSSLLPSQCRRFIGPKFALLRPEFWEARQGMRRRDGSVARILIFFGGSDPSDETSKALKALRSLPLLKAHIDVVSGRSNPRKERIRRLCARDERLSFLEHTDRMADLMKQADLSIGAGGSTSWERCLLGLPTILISVAENQRAAARALADKGAVRYLGDASAVSIRSLAMAIDETAASAASVRAMSRAAIGVMRGVSEAPVARALFNEVTACASCS